MLTEHELTNSMWANYIQAQGIDPNIFELRKLKLRLWAKRRLARDWDARIRWLHSANYTFWDNPKPQYNQIVFQDARRAAEFVLRYA